MFDTIDPQTKAYLKKIMKSIFMGLLWMAAGITAGIFFELGVIEKTWTIGNIIFYTLLVISFLFLLRFYSKLWYDNVFKQ